jgi:hypothetical protein
MSGFHRRFDAPTKRHHRAPELLAASFATLLVASAGPPT